MKAATCVFFSAFVLTTPASGQQRPAPVIDMHLHAVAAASQGPPPLAMCSPIAGLRRDPSQPWPSVFMAELKQPACSDPVWSPATDQELQRRTLEILERRNIIGVASGPIDFVQRWKAAAPDRIIPGLIFNVGATRISPDSIRRLHDSGALAVLGEVTNQYAGIGPSDSLFDPWLAVAEALDMPVGIHIGTGPPGAPYLGFTGYRARLHSPLLLEEALVRHPRLRVYIMHAGWPMLDDLLAVLWTHPQVYVDVGIIVYALPAAEFYRFLRTIVEAGFGDRVMFGSDQMVWPEAIERGIARIESAPFLSTEQKRDILYNNAARFLRLTDTEIARHHGR
jgi:predicted TIM-barrel fold metal-dependent hydrolase